MTKFCLSGIFISILFFSCTKNQPLIQNPERISDIRRMLTQQKELTAKSILPIWKIFDDPLLPVEKEALEFLYAYMPLSDLADYPSGFFLKNVQTTLQSKNEMTWGKTLPEEEFLHFVLPLRVNNENLDSFRVTMYPEIMRRIQGLSMKDAALEINHWCREKVTYRGTDSRTSAPLSTMKKSFGRCGEESTFTVNAMRAACIPARQVYTPRWAHTDDNHAWVEVWIDGKWNYLGACEPDCDLNMGWFSEPARRAMLMHSRTYGRYFGLTDKVADTDRFTELNLTSNYTTVKKITVSVKNSAGTPIDSARVEFQLYNYAELYPIAAGYTNSSGLISLNVGMGDLIIRASKNRESAFQKFSVPEKDSLNLTLSPIVPESGTFAFDLVPPHAARVEQTISEASRKENDRRVNEDNAIRTNYMKGFRDSAWIASFSQKMHLPQDTVSRFINLSYGNWDQIAGYLEKNAASNRRNVLNLASQLSDKDFSDVKESTLTDHLIQASQSGLQHQPISRELFNMAVLSPRISYEMLSPWRSFLARAFGLEMAVAVGKDIGVLTTWIRENVRINSVANRLSRTPMTPIGVYNLRVADPVSRDIFFVAACRTFGIPARLNPENLTPEYFQGNSWLKAGFEAENVRQPALGMLRLTDKNNQVVPQYYKHFTIGILKDGFYKTLEFPEDEKLTLRKVPIELEEGKYAMVTGNRLNDGTVLSSMTFFTIEKGRTIEIPVELRQQAGDPTPSGKLDLEKLTIVSSKDGAVKNLSTVFKGKYVVLVLLDPDNEPSRHVLNEIGPYVDYFNKWSGSFLFVVPKEKAGQVSALTTYKLPVRYEVGMDQDENLLKAIGSIYGSGLREKLPLVLFCDDSGTIYLFSAGYKIGLGEQILKLVSSFEATKKVVQPGKACK